MPLFLLTYENNTSFLSLPTIMQVFLFNPYKYHFIAYYDSEVQILKKDR